MHKKSYPEALQTFWLGGQHVLGVEVAGLDGQLRVLQAVQPSQQALLHVKYG